MQRDPTPGPVDRGLNTEDLAHPEGVPPEETLGAPPVTTESVSQESAGPSGADEALPLLTREDDQAFRERWNGVQGAFVDDPREAVQSADALVAEVMQTLATTFAEQKRGLEGQWRRGEEADTEDLRLALQHYRSFFNRLLTA